MRPSADTNSVQNTSGPGFHPELGQKGLLYFAMIARKGASVTSSMGARAENGFFNFSQNPNSIVRHFSTFAA